MKIQAGEPRACCQEGIRPSYEQRVAVLHRPHVLVGSSGQAKQHQLCGPRRTQPARAYPSAKERAARVSDGVRSPVVRISSPSPDDVEQVTRTPWPFVWARVARSNGRGSVTRAGSGSSPRDAFSALTRRDADDIMACDTPIACWRLHLRMHLLLSSCHVSLTAHSPPSTLVTIPATVLR